MKLTLDRNELWRGLNTVLDAVSSKPAQPVLSNVLLEAEGDRLILSATTRMASLSRHSTRASQSLTTTCVPIGPDAELVIAAAELTERFS